MEPFLALVGGKRWLERMAEIRGLAAVGPRAGQAVRQRHAVELTLEKRRRQPGASPSVAEALLGQIAAHVPEVAAGLTPRGRDKLIAQARLGLSGQNTLVPVFHLARMAELQRSRGFAVAFPGLEGDAPHDLLIARGQAEAEVACDVFTAEEGRDVHQGAWLRLADRVDPALRAWLSAHPGRHLLKITLPLGLRGGLREPGHKSETFDALHRRVLALLGARSRQHHDEAAVLRLDPLLLAGAQDGDGRLMPSLRREFGPEAHLSVTTSGDGVFVMAARAGRENEVAAAIRRRLSSLAPARLTGQRPGILSVFVEDAGRLEWRRLRNGHELEGEARQFMTSPEAQRVVAASFVSRLELFGLGGPDAAAGGELRFRNPRHPAAGSAALAPAVASSA